MAVVVEVGAIRVTSLTGKVARAFANSAPSASAGAWLWPAAGAAAWPAGAAWAAEAGATAWASTRRTDAVVPSVKVAAYGCPRTEAACSIGISVTGGRVSDGRNARGVPATATVAWVVSLSAPRAA